MIKQQGEYLSSIGGDPEQIKKLSDEYAKLSKRKTDLSKSTSGTGTRIKNLVKNFVSAQLVVFAIRKSSPNVHPRNKRVIKKQQQRQNKSSKSSLLFLRVIQKLKNQLRN